ncbi:hypothetical protein BDN72DRAFT_830571 [Pluteus cervinus]|uniref:Uncharacterized protein n=1 Tax=Pluteus cervinus TaxID=181527 RepID=A0ACD3BGS7_9AGAR|nr:hypothetical protein BDN72DRAFT_830571 [Pluteus cervinus]
MPPVSKHSSLFLHILPETFFVLQFHPEQELPPCILKDMTFDSGRFFSITRTQNEVSLVGESRKGMPDKYKEYSTWICIKIAGPMDHNMVGAIADLATPLKAAKVPVFITSTWNTDYVLVPKDMLLEAVNALERDGWIFASTRQHRMARL